MEFNRIIKLLRKERGITQKQAAEDLGVSQALLSHYEKGIRECGLDFVVRVADYYNVSCDYLLYPKGGTAMLTCRQVGQAIAGAAVREKAGFEAIPVAMYNMKWDKFLKIVYEARGMGPDRKIVGVQPWMMKLGMIGIAKDYKKRGIESGMDPFNLPDIMNLDLFINNQYTKELGVQEDDIEAAITDSIRVSQASYDGKVKLLEMKGE